MAYSDPLSKIWAVDEMANAVDLNKYHRDNQRVVWPRLVYKTQDETFNGTSVQDDNELYIGLRGTDGYFFRIFIIWYDDNSGTFGKFRLAFSYPNGGAGMTIRMSAAAANTSAIPSRFTYDAAGDSHDFQPATSQSNNLLVVEGYVSNAVVPGNFRVRWSQSVAVGTNCIVRKGSMIQAMKL